MFDHKNYCWYDVVVSRRIVITLYGHTDGGGNKLCSGTFTACFTCYEPFGKLFDICDDGTAEESALVHTGLLPASMMPSPPSPGSRSMLLYNPGMETANTIVRIAGDVGNGMLIRNLTTGQRCRVVNLHSDSLLGRQAL